MSVLARVPLFVDMPFLRSFGDGTLLQQASDGLLLECATEVGGKNMREWMDDFLQAEALRMARGLENP